MATQHANCRCTVEPDPYSLSALDKLLLAETVNAFKIQPSAIGQAPMNTQYFGGNPMHVEHYINPWDLSRLMLFDPAAATPSPKLSEKEMLDSIEAHLRRGNSLDDLTKLLTESKEKRDAEAAEKAEKQRKAEEAERERKATLAAEKAKLAGLLADVAKATAPHVESRRFVLAYAYVDSTQVTTIEGVAFSDGSIRLAESGYLLDASAASLDAFVKHEIPERVAYHIEYLD